MIENQEFREAFIKWVLECNRIITETKSPLEYLTTKDVEIDHKYEWSIIKAINK